MRCESDDFIQTIDDQDKMWCTFMCEGQKGGKSYLVERKRRGSERERQIAWVQRSGHSHKQLTEM
jgi:hypothetical protein